MENNKNYTVEYYDLQRYGIDCQVAYGFLIHHEVEGFGFDYYLGLLVKNLKVKKVIRVDNFKPHQKFSVARECILFNKIRSNLGFLHTYSVQKKKIFLYFHLLQSFFSCQDSYSDYHDFLWLKYGPRYIYMRNIRSYIQKKIEAIRLRLFMDFKINFDIYFEKIKIFFSEKFNEYSHIAREINFFIRENKERILNFIKENIDLFFFDDDLSILTYGN